MDNEASWSVLICFEMSLVILALQYVFTEASFCKGCQGWWLTIPISTLMNIMNDVYGIIWHANVIRSLHFSVHVQIITEVLETKKAVLADIGHHISFAHGSQKQLVLFSIVSSYKLGIRGEGELWNLQWHDLQVEINNIYIYILGLEYAR